MKKDEVFIKHILDEIDFLKMQSRNLEFEDLVKNEALKRAFPRSFEIIGEAAVYFGINWDILWDVVKNKLPEIEKSIKTIKEKEFD